MKNLFQFIIIILLFGLAVLPTRAAFTSLYVFGDALSTTTNNLTLNQYYYGKRYCNGRVWVEVLAQRQGLTISNNWSYFDCNSSNLLKNLKNFNIAQKVANNALFVIWVNNSDMYEEALNDGTDPSKWTAAINRSQTNHLSAIINLYNQGVRTFVMPNAVDVSRIPEFNADYGATNFIRQECILYDIAFSNTLNQARSLCPGIQIFSPNFFALLDNVLANSASFGLTNALINYGRGNLSIDAMDALGTACKTNGPGTNYIFWDALDPTAQFHEVIADVAQQIISPAQINQLTVLTGNNQLDLANVPVGLNGFVDGSTNLAQAIWTTVTNFNSINTAQSVFVIAPQLLPSTPGSGSGGSGSIDPNNPGDGGGTNIPAYSAAQFYRVRFPYAWLWP